MMIVRTISLLVVMCVLWVVPTAVTRSSDLLRSDVRDVYVVEGDSVAPFGYADGDLVTVAERLPVVGDMIAFTCMHPSCSGHYIKRLTKQNGACYWIEGRRDLWIGADGRQKYSVDAVTTFGWLCGQEIDVIGVVERL